MSTKPIPRSGEEIRAHLADLERALLAPCNCESSGHGKECREGGMLIKVAIGALKWVLNEQYEGYQERVVEVFRREGGHG